MFLLRGLGSCMTKCTKINQNEHDNAVMATNEESTFLMYIFIKIVCTVEYARNVRMENLQAAQFAALSNMLAAC